MAERGGGRWVVWRTFSLRILFNFGHVFMVMMEQFCKILIIVEFFTAELRLESANVFELKELRR